MAIQIKQTLLRKKETRGDDDDDDDEWCSDDDVFNARTNQTHTQICDEKIAFFVVFFDVEKE